MKKDLISEMVSELAPIPEDAALITAGVDVQNDRVEIDVVIWDRNYEPISVLHRADYDLMHGL